MRPASTAATCALAADALADHDAVFGPALDGGYTLVGLRRATPALFDAMPWSTAAVMAARPAGGCAGSGFAMPSWRRSPISTSQPTCRTCPPGWLDRPATLTVENASYHR